MRSISAAGLAEIAKNLGTEPVIIIEIQWSDGASVKRYGDVADPDNNVVGNIQEVAGLDNVITISGVSQGTTGESAQISVTLSDVEGSIKNILDSTDVHKQTAWVYQWYPDLAFSDRFLLFKGQISSPIEWHEGDRTVRFDIINQIEDGEVGFSAEEANIEFLPEDLIGVAWPLCFGTCINVPGLRMRSPYKGILRTGFGVHDYTLACKLDQIQKMCCPLIFAGWRTVRSPSPPFSVDLIATFQEEPGCKCRRLARIQEWTAEIELQKSYEFTQIEIIDGEQFPRGTITLDICGAQVRGHFSGDSGLFEVGSHIHPKVGELVCPETVNRLACTSGRAPTSEGGSGIGGGFYNKRDDLNDFGVTVNAECGDTDNRNNLGWDYLSTFPTADFFWAEPGCEVFLVGDEEVVYVANILPSTILRVAAYRTFESGVRELVTIPASLYTARLSNFSPYSVTEIVFDQLLSRRGEGWEDEVYISLTSSVGPNTVDILTWIINMYTNFSIDAGNFAAVKAQIENYPSHFPLLERRNVLDVLRDIAFQARCALYLRNDEFTLKYLPDEPSVDFTIDDDDVMPKTLVMSHTETEELVTKFVAEWKFDHAIEKPNTVILRYNIQRYGTQERKFDFFIYNILELVEKSATFWLIRMANTWRKVKFRTPITKLQAEVFDVADVSLPDFSASTIKCLVEKATYDSDNHEIEFELWTPVRSGETEPFVFAWPSQIAINHLWPTLEDQNAGLAGGSGPNVDVTAPNLHPLSKPNEFKGASLKKRNCNDIINSYSGDILGQCRQDHGDKQPSDLDDEKPGVNVPGQGETDIPTSKNPTGEASTTTIINNETLKDEADKTQQTIRGGQGSDGGNGQESGKNEPEEGENPVERLPCVDPDDLPDCTVCVWWSEIIIKKVVSPEGITTDPGKCGVGLDGTDLGQQQLCFNSLQAAKDAAAAIQAEIPDFPPGVCNGEQYPIPGSIVVPLFQQVQWSLNGCEEPTEEDGGVQANSYCPSDEAAASEGGSDTAQKALEGGLGV
jgi:hypothetical protein